MPNVIGTNGSLFNSAYSLCDIGGFEGLVLESWGPATRNPQYNDAFDTILERLILLSVPSINIFVVSANLIKAFPNMNDREISVDNKTDINLINVQPKDLRLEIGRQQANLKINPKTKGGNRTKRILIHNKNIDHALWQKVVTGLVDTKEYISHINEPTLIRSDLENKVKALLETELLSPTGNIKPTSSITKSISYERDPRVKAWTLLQSKGLCEVCDTYAPFLKEDGMPYLEVHHVVPLSEGGRDTVSNTIAICPNCHMKLHYGENKIAARNEIINKIERLCI